VKATLALARQRFKIKYKLMTTEAVYDKEVLISSHLCSEQYQRCNGDYMGLLNMPH